MYTYDVQVIVTYKKYLIASFLACILLAFYFFLYKIYMPRVNAFGCFDDCFNFMGGYFLLHNKHLFSEIFYNHAPGMAYLSAAIQAVTHPQNLYDLVLKHRQFVFFFGLSMNMLLLLRFGYKVLGFTTVFELTKFLVFGDRFLAEGIIVYPLVYLAGLGWKKLQGNAFFYFDWTLSGLFIWFVLWTREPFVLLTLFLFGVILWGRKEVGEKILSAGIVIVLSVATLLYHNIAELYFNVISINSVASVSLGDQSNIFMSLLHIFLYPFFVLIQGNTTFLRSIEISVAVIFIVCSMGAIVNKKWQFLLYSLLVLGLANLRFTPPGMEYYAAFHQIVWYGLFLFLTIFTVTLLPKKWMRIFGQASFIAIVISILLSPQSFWKNSAHPYEEFITNYGKELQVGEIVQTLSQPKDTLFLDGFDDIIYWVSKRYSSYQYSWYTSLMPRFSKYTTARTTMFTHNPPDFYYGSCLKVQLPQQTLTSSQQALYVRLLDNGRPSCLWVKKTKIPSITPQQWNKAREGYYTLPPNDALEF